MTTITIDEIQRDLLGYLQRVAAGETLVIMQADEPMAEIKPVVRGVETPRPWGLAIGEFRLPDDFNLALPDAIVRDFEGL